MDPRHRIGAAAELAAEWFLVRRDVAITDRNVRIGRGEIDLVGVHGREPVAFEVRAVTGDIRIDDRFSTTKRSTVHRLARSIGVWRVDVVGVGIGPDRIVFHWSRAVAAD